MRKTPSRVELLGANLVALASVLAGKLLIAVGLRRAPDGWRRTVGLLLRSESTRFAVSVFGLRVPATAGDPTAPGGRAGLAAELRRYLAGQRDAHYALEWHDDVTVRLDTDRVDVTVLDFDDEGTLRDVAPALADDTVAAPSDDERRSAHRAIVEAYNRTRTLPEVVRPGALRRAVGAALAGGRAEAYAGRLLSSCCLSFESIEPGDPTRRFRPPEFRARRNLGFGYLTVVMRLAADQQSVDVWMSAHHVGLDGVPLQELADGLERAWGQAAPVSYPPPDGDEPFMTPRACHCPDERPVDECLVFVDFAPLVSLRAALNDRHAEAIGAPATFGAVLAWMLAGEPEFAGVRIASTVDVAASGGYERDVDVVPLRPADYARQDDPWAGFVEFAREFNRLVGLSRERRSPLRGELQTAGLLPPWVHSTVVRANPSALDTTFGSLCITIIRDARVFVAPMTDLGLGHGFVAVGSASLPTADGRRVTSVSIKGDAGRIGNHAAALRRAIARAARLLAEGQGHRE